MAERLMIKCDNPKCKSVGVPEWEPSEEERATGTRPTGPYGWHQGSGWLVGCGPKYIFDACSDECVGPAIEAVLREAREEEEMR
jgi:hypothetical protein